MPLQIRLLDGGLLRLTLNRPEKRNAFSFEMLAELHERFDAIRLDSACRIILLSASGNDFCAGIDLKEAMLDDSMAFRMTASIHELLLKIRHLPQIVIASLQGAARGSGAALALACDLVVAADNATLAFPEARRGLEPVLLFPLLRRKLNDSALRELLLTGFPVHASRAQHLGLFHYLAGSTEPAAAAETLAREILRGEPEALRETKRMIIAHENTQFTPSLEEEFRAAREAHARSWRSPEAREGVGAFLEKRLPNWVQ